MYLAIDQSDSVHVGTEIPDPTMVTKWLDVEGAVQIDISSQSQPLVATNAQVCPEWMVTNNIQRPLIYVVEGDVVYRELDDYTLTWKCKLGNDISYHAKIDGSVLELDCEKITIDEGILDIPIKNVTITGTILNI